MEFRSPSAPPGASAPTQAPPSFQNHSLFHTACPILLLWIQVSWLATQELTRRAQSPHRGSGHSSMGLGHRHATPPQPSCLPHTARSTSTPPPAAHRSLPDTSCHPATPHDATPTRQIPSSLMKPFCLSPVQAPHLAITELTSSPIPHRVLHPKLQTCIHPPHCCSQSTVLPTCFSSLQHFSAELRGLHSCMSCWLLTHPLLTPLLLSASLRPGPHI